MTQRLLLSLVPRFVLRDTATTDLYTLSLHDALPISTNRAAVARLTLLSVTLKSSANSATVRSWCTFKASLRNRSEEHTSELQSLTNLVCRLLLEKKKEQPVNLMHPDHARHDTWRHNI